MSKSLKYMANALTRLSLETRILTQCRSKPAFGIKELVLRNTTASVKAERDLLISVLETLSQSRHMNEYLERLVEQIK